MADGLNAVVGVFERLAAPASRSGRGLAPTTPAAKLHASRICDAATWNSQSSRMVESHQKVTTVLALARQELPRVRLHDFAIYEPSQYAEPVSLYVSRKISGVTCVISVSDQSAFNRLQI